MKRQVARKIVCLTGDVLLVSATGAFAQTIVAPPSSLENISNCTLQGTDVFIQTGQGSEQRRFKYPWDASIDALCNAKGFAISSPQKPVGAATPSTTSSPPAPPTPTAASPPTPGFPADAIPISGNQISQVFSDKRYSVRLSDGSTWRLDYKSNGYFFVNTSTGFNGSGTWKIKEDQVCTDGKGMNASCGVVHKRGDSLFMKRSANGEIIELKLQ